MRDLPPGQEVDEWYDVTLLHQEKSASSKFFQIVRLYSSFCLFYTVQASAGYQ